MSREKAQGRLKRREPVAVIDIGSNSVRLVVYEGVVRAPTVLFNEKILCGLGKGLVKTNRLNDKSVEQALNTLRRFRALAHQAGAQYIHTLATAAAREAENGPAFLQEAQDILQQPIQLLSGKQEAKYSAKGIVSGFYKPDGIVGDLGGGSLELVDLTDTQIGDGITLPLGGLRLKDMANNDLKEASAIARLHLRDTNLLERGRNRVFYAVGGTWRNLAKLHMFANDYPLHVMHGYEMQADEAESFLDMVVRANPDEIRGIKAVSKNRRQLLPYGAAVLLETIRRMRPQKLVFSGLGVREGYLYSLLSKKRRKQDPLISAADEMAVLHSRSPKQGYELIDWTQQAFELFGFEETEDQRRYREAACLLADIGWRAHPDYRGDQAFNIVAHSSFYGIDHPGRAYVALVVYYRNEGVVDDIMAPSILQLATAELAMRAKLTGALLRVATLLSASMAGILPSIVWGRDKDGFVLKVPKSLRDLIADRPLARLQQLAKLIDQPIRFVFID